MNTTSNYPDAMISVALDRQAEKVRRVQAYGSSEATSLGGQTPHTAWAAAQVGRVLVAGVAVVGVLLALINH